MSVSELCSSGSSMSTSSPEVLTEGLDFPARNQNRQCSSLVMASISDWEIDWTNSVRASYAVLVPFEMTNSVFHILFSRSASIAGRSLPRSCIIFHPSQRRTCDCILDSHSACLSGHIDLSSPRRVQARSMVSPSTPLREVGEDPSL